MKEKQRVESTGKSKKTRASMEETLAGLMLKVKELEARALATESLQKDRPNKLKLRVIEGTGSQFWEVRKPIVIRQNDADTGRFYKSADGRRIRVFWVNKTFHQAPVIGMLEVEPGVWDARVWFYDGGTRKPFGHGSNIVGFWEE